MNKLFLRCLKSIVKDKIIRVWGWAFYFGLRHKWRRRRVFPTWIETWYDGAYRQKWYRIYRKSKTVPDYW